MQRRQERDLRFIAPLIGGLSDLQYQLWTLVQSATVRHRESNFPAINDSDVAEAAKAFAATLETADRGIIYEHQVPSVPAARLLSDLKAAALEWGKAVRKSLDRDIAEALRRTERGARSAGKELGEPGDSVYLELMARMLRTAHTKEAGEGVAETSSEPPAPQSKLVLP